ncbi:S49 family peptidase, partial [Acinetobacter baumannii]
AAYTGIQNDIVQYMNTASVRGILLDVDSPGGEVAGLAELAEFIAEAAKEKPIYAVANSLMASAAYWMSSGATRIYAAPNSAVGSIGVVTAHVD